MHRTFATLLFACTASLSAADAKPAEPAPGLAPLPAVAPAPVVAVPPAKATPAVDPVIGRADPKAAPTLAPAVLDTPADTTAASANATSAPVDQVYTITLTNLNQIVGTIIERDSLCLTLQTAEGLMKLRLNKILREETGGKLLTTTGSGTAATGSTSSTASTASTSRAPAMSSDERTKAALKKLKDANKQIAAYQQAIQTHVGGVPQGVLPTDYAQLQQNQQNPNAQNNPYGAKQSTWQPFAGDSPKTNNTNGSNNANNPYGNAAYPQQGGYVPYNGYNNGSNNGQQSNPWFSGEIPQNQYFIYPQNNR